MTCTYVELRWMLRRPANDRFRRPPPFASLVPLPRPTVFGGKLQHG